MNFSLLKFRVRTSITGAAKFLIHLGGTLLAGPFIKYGRPKYIPLRSSRPRILYICLAFRGDLILNFPAIKAIKKAYPLSKITCWVREYNVELARLNGNIDEVVCYDRFPHSGIGFLLRLPTISRDRAIIDRIRNMNFDVCIDDSGYGFTSMVCLLAGIPCRIGRNSQGFGFLYHYEYPYDFNAQLIEKRIRLLEPLRIKVGNVDDLFPLIAVPRELLRPVIEKCGVKADRSRYITIQPFGGWAAKNWDIDKYAQVVDSFTTATGIMPIFIGGPEDAEGISRIVAGIRTGSINMAGKLTLVESAILITGAEIHLGVDSFGTNFAAAVGVAGLAIFGPTNPRLIAHLGPRNVAVLKRTRCTPSEKKIYCCPDAGRSCKHLACMNELQAEQVLSVLMDLWEGRQVPTVTAY